jgi:hypothetical protein
MDGDIANNREAAFAFMLEKGKELGLVWFFILSFWMILFFTPFP